MKAVLKIEFQRLFRSVTFYISLGIGLILTMTQFVMVGLQESMHILDAYSPKGDKQIFGCDTSVFIKLFFSHAGSQYTKVSSESDCDI